MKRKSAIATLSPRLRRVAASIESRNTEDDSVESIEDFDDDSDCSPPSTENRDSEAEGDAAHDTSIQSFSDSFNDILFDQINPENAVNDSYDDILFNPIEPESVVAATADQEYESSIQSFTEDDRSDRIESFGDNVLRGPRLSTDNILDGVDQWRPRPDSSQLSSQWSHHPESDHDEPLESPHFVFPAPTNEPEVDDLPHSPQFILPSSPVVPQIYPQAAPLNPYHQQRSMEPVKLLPNGLAATAFNVIQRSKQEHANWEREMKAQMARHGSILQLYLDNDGAELYRILDMKAVYGNITGRCVRLRETEVEYLKQQRRHCSSDADEIEEFSQPVTLPAYDPREDDEEVSVIFSFRFSQTSETAISRFMHEELVAIFDRGNQDTDILTTRFMADSLH